MDSPLKSFNPNKHLKEAFVSNLTGSSMLQVFAISAVLPVVILIRHFMGSATKNDHVSKGTSLKKNDDQTVGLRNWRDYVAAMAVDFCSIVLPIILLSTVLAEWTYVNAICLIFVLLFAFAYKRHGSSLYQEEGGLSLRSCISSYRVSMMLVTCLYILAVDFKIFPRRYAKTETYGTSVMDLGVASFVLGNSMVSRQARGISTMNLQNSVLSTSPLLFLGFARLVSTTGLDYQVHVGEYGVHWNFFFTLAAVTLLTSVINVPLSYCGFIGSFILIGYQVFLSLGLNAFLLSANRGTDIISQNKEGIFSIFGYWGVYLIGVQLGSYLFVGSHVKTNLGANRWARSRVWSLSLLFWCLTLMLDRYVESPSRRMCNLAYVTFVLATNLQVLGITMLADYIPGWKLTVLEEAFNQNLLMLFLTANLLTGFINLSVDTLSVPTLPALVILIIYGSALCAVAGFAHFHGFRLKFW